MRLTKEELRIVVDSHSNGVKFEQFRHCNAYISDIIYDSNYKIAYRLIKSYNTIVGILLISAVINDKSAEFIEFGKWSRTTSKQVTQIYNWFRRGHENEISRLYCEIYK